MWLLVEVSQHRHVLSAVFQMGEKRWSVLRSRLHGSGCCSSMEPGCRQIALRAEFFLASGRDCDRPTVLRSCAFWFAAIPPTEIDWQENELGKYPVISFVWEDRCAERPGITSQDAQWLSQHTKTGEDGYGDAGVSRDTGDWSDDLAGQGYSVPKVPWPVLKLSQRPFEVGA